MTGPDLKAPEHYINRELSLLEFNQRVLTLSLDDAVPLLERLRFLCIASSNLDEFFEIRVASLKQLQELDPPRPGPDGMSTAEQLTAIHSRAVALVAEQYRCLNDVLLPALQTKGIQLLSASEWTDDTRRQLEEYFGREVEPVLSPLGLDPARPFPRIQNKSLNFIARLSGRDAFGRDSELGVVQAPRSLPRVVAVSVEGSQRRLVLLSTIVGAFVHRLFPGIEVLECHQFRVTRNSELYVDEEEVDDLRHALMGELAHRRYGAAVRLETSHDCPGDITAFLLRQFALTEQDLYAVPGPVNLNRLSALIGLVARADLMYPAFTPAMPRQLSGDLFEAIRLGDVLLHHPFQSFTPVSDFVRQAAGDPHVLAIKQTLYRTGADTPMADALVAAAQAGKDVTIIVELRARFDEEANIALSSRLQEAGVHVMYGVVGFKTHAKMTLVVRREQDGLRRYCHLATGNYHPSTARSYTDYGLFTCDEDVGKDVHDLFLQLTSLTGVPKLRCLLQSPFQLQEALFAKIAREAEHARAGRGARIIAKMNALVDPQVIEALYVASCAGVQIDLIVRGICSLRPGLPGVSENIRVRSIVGRFLEHTRVFFFENDGASELYCSSADWMERNFFRRVEIAFPVRVPALRQQIRQDLDLYLRDKANAWLLDGAGRYTRVTPSCGEGAQAALLAQYAIGTPVVSA